MKAHLEQEIRDREARVGEPAQVGGGPVRPSTRARRIYPSPVQASAARILRRERERRRSKSPAPASIGGAPAPSTAARDPPPGALRAPHSISQTRRASGPATRAAERMRERAQIRAQMREQERLRELTRAQAESASLPLPETDEEMAPNQEAEQFQETAAPASAASERPKLLSQKRKPSFSSSESESGRANKLGRKEDRTVTGDLQPAPQEERGASSAARHGADPRRARTDDISPGEFQELMKILQNLLLGRLGRRARQRQERRAGRLLKKPGVYRMLAQRKAEAGFTMEPTPTPVPSEASSDSDVPSPSSPPAVRASKRSLPSSDSETEGILRPSQVHQPKYHRNM
jgi:hypothetical protein